MLLGVAAVGTAAMAYRSRQTRREVSRQAIVGPVAGDGAFVVAVVVETVRIEQQRVVDEHADVARLAAGARAAIADAIARRAVRNIRVPDVGERLRLKLIACRQRGAGVGDADARRRARDRQSWRFRRAEERKPGNSSLAAGEIRKLLSAIFVGACADACFGVIGELEVLPPRPRQVICRPVGRRVEVLVATLMTPPKAEPTTGWLVSGPKT